MRTERGMALLDSMLAMLVLAIGLSPGAMLLTQARRDAEDLRQHSWALWQAHNLVEQMLLAPESAHQALAAQAKGQNRRKGCGTFSATVTPHKASPAVPPSGQLRFVTCFHRPFAAVLLVPAP